MRYFLCICAVMLAAEQSAAATERTIAPDWALATVDGKTLRLSEEARRQTTVLFFWATWCPYCKALMPHLQSMRLEYGDTIKILAINIREDSDPLEFIQSSGYDFTLLPDGDVVAERYGIEGTPGVIVIGNDRTVHFDLRRLPPLTLPTSDKAPTNASKAAYLAPYWAAEIRKSIDSISQGHKKTD
jgi:thiol-disulfide isomerase/thioredoxin